MPFRDIAEKLFGSLQKALKRLELELEYNFEISLQSQKGYQESLGFIAELEQLIMQEEDEEEIIKNYQYTQQLPDDSSNSISFDDKDHQLLMTQLKDNINLVNDYKQQIQEIRRQNQLINKLAKDSNNQSQSFDLLKENNNIDTQYQRKQLRNFERVKDIEKKIKEKQKNLYKMQKKMKINKDYDFRLLNQIEKLDDEIEKITNQIRYLID